MKLKNYSYFTILILSLGILTSGSYHKFYVSLTEVYLLPEKGKIEISMRVFPDDLDKAIKNIYGENPQLATEFEHEKADQWAEAYLKSNFEIYINGEKLALQYIGKETEANALWFYLEADLDKAPSVVTIKNSFLTEIFDKQKNIIQLYYNDFNKGLLLDIINTEESIVIKE